MKFKTISVSEPITETTGIYNIEQTVNGKTLNLFVTMAERRVGDKFESVNIYSLSLDVNGVYVNLEQNLSLKKAFKVLIEDYSRASYGDMRPVTFLFDGYPFGSEQKQANDLIVKFLENFK